MISPKTKDLPPKRISLIAFSLIVGVSTLALSTHALITTPVGASLVKDDTTTLPSAEGVVSDPDLETSFATDNKPLITVYKVVSGDTLSGVAEKFDISVNTIRWANDISSKEAIHVGDTLTILPVTGIQYTVKKGDTISGIAVKFDVSQSDILDFNDIEGDKILPGVALIIPDGEPIVPPKPVVKKVTPVAKVVAETKTDTQSTPTTETKVSSEKYFIAPLPGSVLSQRLHDGSAVDMAIKSGSVVLAAASGVVTKVKDSNVWNGGYGYYLMIKHDNGTETLYAHLSRIDVEVGQEVEQGEAIALSGKTGRVTGPHLHFEVRGAPNQFASDKLGTRY